MSARYLVRFDDICPTMCWETWDRVEAALDRHGINPIVAVVPDNRDPKLIVGTARSDFWQRVRDWQARGWTIALHGHQHLYESTSAGLMGINHFSEFAGLPEVRQRAKLDAALRIFSEHGVRADAWVAPAHAFDAATVKLLLERGIHVISDGFYHRPVRYLGALWLPQQLWRFRAMPFGLWTVCLHHNTWSAGDIEAFELALDRFAAQIVTVPEAGRPGGGAERSWLDRMVARAWRLALQARQRRLAA
jgi:predicted deacetylase